MDIKILKGLIISSKARKDYQNKKLHDKFFISLHDLVIIFSLKCFFFFVNLIANCIKKEYIMGVKKTR
ncbi:hypothetical protein BEN83_03925 [Ligilactobacillus agilis]|nr:hypothetical protein BEN83_03925 [Ligilactobacillus agilis]